MILIIFAQKIGRLSEKITSQWIGQTDTIYFIYSVAVFLSTTPRDVFKDKRNRPATSIHKTVYLSKQ